MDLIIQLVLGAIGGNIGGALMKNLSLGPLATASPASLVAASEDRS